MHLDWLSILLGVEEGFYAREKCVEAKKARKGLVTDECLAALYGSASPLAAAIGMLF